MAKTFPIWLLKHPDQAPTLRRAGDPVDLHLLATPEWQDLIATMIRTMYKAKGIGLAAPQIGRSVRLAVIDKDLNGGQELVMVNPRVSVLGSEQTTAEEGCLSIPGVYGLVTRPRRIKLQAFDAQGQAYELTADDLLARVIQHEIDHLNGRLFVDRVERITSGRWP